MPRLDRNRERGGMAVPSLGRDVALVGRDDVLARLAAELDEVVSGTFRTVVVAGRAGVGKTRLVAEALDRHAPGLTALTARSYRWGATTSFGPWLEALERHLPDRAAASPASGRGQLLETLASVLLRLSEDGAVVVAIDDLHLADSSAWEALRYLSRRLATAPVGVLATVRPAELAEIPIAQEVLLGLEDDDVLTRIELEPLARHHVAALAHEVLRGDPRVPSAFVPEPLVTWLTQRTLGHPLFAIGLLRALVDEGADLAAPRLERTPETLRERVAMELQTLEPDHRRLLELLAVVGRRVDLDGVEAIARRPGPELAAALEQLSRAQLVVEHGRGTDLRYEIAHPVIQDVIYESIGGARRSVLHRTVARVMRTAGQHGTAAAHYARAGVRDGEAVEALFDAMEQAGERDLYREALAVLAGLLDVLPAGDPRWRRVLDSVTMRSEWVLSHLAEADAGTAIEAMTRVVAVLRESGEVRPLAVAEFHLGAFESFGAGRLHAAERALRDAIARFREAGDLEGELLATNELAWTRGSAGDLEGHAALALDVLDRAADADLPHPMVQAAGTAAYASGLLGRFADARALFERSIRLAGDTGNRYRVAWGHAQAAYFLGMEGRIAEAIEAGARSLDTDPAAPDALAFENLAHCYWLAGRLEDAVAAVERSLARRPVIGSRRRAWGAGVAARGYAEMGQRGRARSNLERVASSYDGEFLAWSVWRDWCEGWLAWTDGDGAGASAALRSAARRLREIGAAGYEPLVLSDLGEVAADRDDRDLLESVAGRAAELATVSEGTLAGWLAATARARVRLASGDLGAAVTAATEAERGLGEAGYALLAASASEVRGRALVDQDRAAAADALQDAAGRFEACGAVWRRDRVLALLTALGSRGRRAAAAVQGPTSLTAREREVAVLTARGHTAVDVGERLFIGKRTVETHLANIYAKLGVDSKRELIARADEFGLRGGSVSDSVPATEVGSDLPP